MMPTQTIWALVFLFLNVQILATPEEQKPDTRPHRPCPRFSLRTLFAGVTAVAVTAGAVGFHLKRQAATKALLAAAKEGDLEKAKKAIAAWADVSADEDAALRAAADSGSIEIVKLLLEHGADIHANDDEALRNACANGSLEMVKVLITEGADIHVSNEAPLRYSAHSGHIDVVRFLLDNGATTHSEKSILSDPVYDNHYDVVKLLLDRGADPNEQGGYPLFCAVHFGNTKMVELLLSRGAHVSDDNLNFAKEKKKWEILDLLQNGPKRENTP